jgi:hypothetical protein
MKLGDMTDRELILFAIGEVRACKKLLSNHLHHHEKQDDRRWKLRVALVIAGISAATAVVVALL